MFLKRYFLLLVCGLFLAFTAFAQNAHFLHGKLIDAASGAGLAYGSVALCNVQDSSVVDGVLTRDDGTFQFEKSVNGPFYLLARYVGYQKKSVSLSQAQIAGDSLVNISLNAAAGRLNEVVVRDEKTILENKADRQVYRADQFLNARGGTALDVVKNTPSVTVNAEGDITMRGSNGLMVLLNGKPVQTSASELLQQIPANSIENIEIITSPSARFDPDGKGGIINITTRKAVQGSAFTASIQGGLPSVRDYGNLHQPLRFGGDLTYNVQRGKWNLSLGGSYLRNDIAGRRVGNASTTIGNVFTAFPSDGERSYIRYNYTGRAALTFEPDAQNAFSIGFYKGFRSQSRRADIVYQNTKVNTETGQNVGRVTYFNSNIARKSSDIQLANFDYTHTFDNKSALTFSFLYEKADLDGLTTNLNLAEPGRQTLLQSTRNPSANPLTAFRGRADYSVTIGPGKLEAGYQYRDQLQKGDFEYLNLNFETNIFERVPEFSSTTRVTNRIHSVYTQYAGKSGKLEYAGGLRYEYARRVFVAAAADTRELNLSNLFPSLSLNYKLTDVWRVKAGYNKRVQRSTNSELNPFPEREHSETLESGDPDILPEFVDLSEVGVVREFKSGSVFATFYNQRIKHVVNRVNSVYNDTIINRIYTNAGLAVSWGLEVGGNVNLTRRWQLYAGGNVYHYSIKGALFKGNVPVNSSSVVYNVNANSTFRFSPTLQIQGSVNYLSKRVTAQGEDSRFLIPALTARKTFWAGKLALSLQWQNINAGLLGSNKQRITTFGKDFFTTTNYIQETDIFLLNLTLNLNQLNKKSKLPTSEFGEREF
ncbi:TonB-dependent receptor domain-containing protein [Dyadobacter luticola]|uniref:TonB-dependent receptor n=1 Tax=Dyadobacter luticola TaxID=1979387 RepID=A0A5R9L6S0_9BACT|nr:TonB-dependent receptor [Dyadobacter luticola]TLV04099.1 TonB-dependent receptor [Dyadobacter luticola]